MNIDNLTSAVDKVAVKGFIRRDLKNWFIDDYIKRTLLDMCRKYREELFNRVSIYFTNGKDGSEKGYYIPMFEILSQCLTIILMIMGGFMVIDGEMTIGNMVTVNGYLWMLNSPLRQAGWIINDLQRFLTAIEKIYKVYTTEPDIKQPEHVVEKRS